MTTLEENKQLARSIPEDMATDRNFDLIDEVIAVDIFRERVFLRNEDQGSRIIPLAQLRAELEQLGEVFPTADVRSRGGDSGSPESSHPS
jgi:hypothetical protein